MFREIPILADAQIEQLKQIAAAAKFVDGRFSNPHSKVKNNLQLHEPESYQRSAQILTQALYGSDEFQNFAFPVLIAPPMLTRYTSGMHYGAHSDAAFLQIGQQALRSDLSCTVFLNDPASYEGGALTIHLGTSRVSFRCAPGTAIVYPSDTFHEVELVTRGERLVAITFIQSRLPDSFQRNLMFELNEIAALAGNTMAAENFSMLQLVRDKLLRHWADKP